MVCWMSHIDFWKKISKLNKPGIIFEDDVELVENFSDKVNNILDDAKKFNWDIILFAHNWNTGKHPISKHLSSIKLFYGTQNYIIKPSCANYLIKKYNDTSKLSKQIDVELGEINVKGEIKILAATNFLTKLSYLARTTDTNIY